MKTTKKINITIEKTNTGFSAYSNDYPIFTTATSILELIANSLEASNLYFEEQNEIITKDRIRICRIKEF